MAELIYTEEQQGAIKSILEFLVDCDGRGVMVLEGPAGTGKTSIIQEVARQSGLDFAFTAPTNKATKVLRETIDGAIKGPRCTIYSLLGLRLEANGDVKELMEPDPDAGEGLKAVDAVILDEGSMANKLLCRILKEKCEQYNVPLLVMGDPYQLPPVKETLSPIWQEPLKVELKTIMRHDNQILKLATHIRGQVGKPNSQLVLASDNDGAEEGVWKLPRTTFEDFMIDAAKKGEFTAGTTKAIAWRNAMVSRMNQVIRAAIMGPQDLPFVPGDRIIAVQPLNIEKEKLMHTDDEGLVTVAESTRHPSYPDFQCMKVSVKKDDGGRVVTVYAIHPESSLALSKKLKELSFKASTEDKKHWKEFWKLKEAFHEIRPAYAITAHRSQGSTYHTTFVDSKDILVNPDRNEALRCFYVACTRSKKKLYLV